MPTKNTLYVSVNCCNERSRYEMWRQVSDNVREQFSQNIDDIIIFDNASTHPAYPTTLRGFKHVFRCNVNIGYWSALDWLLQNHEHVTDRQYDFIHVIEPDRLYFAARELDEIERFIQNNESVGAVKCHLYDVVNWRRFCKPRVDLVDYNEPGAVKSDWVSHWNDIKDKQVVTIRIDDRWHLSDFHVQLHNVLRISFMRSVFEQLRYMESFRETDFMHRYAELNNVVAVYDGGIFESSLGLNDDKETIACSTTPENTLKQHGYKIAHTDCLLPHDAYIVSHLIA